MSVSTSLARTGPAQVPSPLGVTPAAAIPSPWTTPRRLVVGAGLVVLATVVFLVQAMTMVERSRSALHTVQKDTAPSIVAAQQIRASLADLDANAANELLGSSQQRQVAHRVFEQRRVEITDALVKAAENITFGDAERQPILQLVEHLGRYLELQADARTKLDLNLVPQARAAYRAAHEEMNIELTAGAELDRVNRQQLDAAYNAQRASDGAAQTLAMVTGILLVAALFFLQLYLARRTRRFFSIPLVLATALSIGAVITVSHAFASAQDSLRLAKEDAFDSMHLLYQARAIAYQANGDESRFLLDASDPSRRTIDEQSFHSEVESLQTDLFPRELGNVTFNGELAAAKTMVAKFQEYLRVDDRIRDLERKGQHDQAVELCIGTLSTESNAVFGSFDDGLGATLKINSDVFAQETDASDAALRRVVVLLPILALLVAIGALFGVRPRLREYAV